MSFSDWLQDQILRSGHDRREIAKIANIPKNQMNDICNGGELKRGHIRGLAYALNLNVYEVEDAIDGVNGIFAGPIGSCQVADLTKVNDQIEKPGEKVKSSKIKNSFTRLHDIKKPDDKTCWICNTPDDGTCYFHHMEVPYYKIKYGSGTGQKVIDKLTVWAHHTCGTELSIQPLKSDPEITHLRYEVQWSRLIIENKII